MDVILAPIRIATSKPAQRSYINTILFVSASGVLAFLAATAYILFYVNFIPQKGVYRPIHLRFGESANPYGIATFSRALTSQQPYDITVSLRLPRSPSNIAAGNFMLDLTLLASEPDTTLQIPYSTAAIPPADILYHAKRHAILTYESTIVSLARRLAKLPAYVIGLKREDETLVVSIGEGVRFARGSRNVPDAVFLEVRRPDGGVVQVYDVAVALKARFEGIRWWMYNHRILSFAIGTSAFWGMEVLFVVLGWGILVLHSSAGVNEDATKVEKKVKEEEIFDFSDTERSFPTYGRQAPLRYVPKVKMEEGEEVEQPTVEADDESEEPVDIGGFHGAEDSGLGTSLSEGGSLSRRRSRKSER